MGADPHETPSANSTPAPRGGAVLVRVAKAPPSGVDEVVKDWHRLLPAFITSMAVHCALGILFLCLHGPASGETANMEQAVVDTKVEDEKQYNLENPDIGNDPDLRTNYDMPRIEDISVPGPVNPSEEVGILNADPNAVKETVPPPPGLGDNRGQGGGVDSTIFGKGNAVGFAGGMGGPLMKPGGFGGRSGATRERMVTEGGGNSRSEAAVARGLIWLVQHQSTDGKWSLDGFMKGRCNCQFGGQQNDTAGTAFGLLPLLGAGQTHKGGGKNASAYAKNVERALKYLMLKQSSDGNFGGGMYAHGLATIAICEAYGLTSDPALQRPAQQAINFICAAQNKEKGGWRYQPRTDSDTSVTGWEVMALKSGQMAGLDVPSPVLEGATRWLNHCASPDGGGYGYTGPADGASAMTAVGLLCRQYLGWGPRAPGLQAGVKKLQTLPPNNPRASMYYNYYATQVMHHMGGPAWKDWNEKMRDFLINSQDEGRDPKHTHQKGSWFFPKDPHHTAGGRLMMTSLPLLTLEVYYRHLPLYRRDMAGAK
jgi:hypothetical protein